MHACTVHVHLCFFFAQSEGFKRGCSNRDGRRFADFNFNFISDGPLRCVISFSRRSTRTNNTKTYITMIHKTH